MTYSDIGYILLAWHEQRRRQTPSTRWPSPGAQILDALAGGEHPVNDLVAELGLAQPQVSKNLRVSAKWERSKCERTDGSGSTA